MGAYHINDEFRMQTWKVGSHHLLNEQKFNTIPPHQRLSQLDLDVLTLLC